LQNSDQVKKGFKMNIKAIGVSILSAIMLVNSSCEKKDYNLGVSVTDTVKTYGLNSAKAVDMVLLYNGGINRPSWTQAEVEPYVTYVDPDTGEENWLYDGFLFLDFADGTGRSFVAPVKDGEQTTPARKIEWEAMLNSQFATDKAIDALNKKITAKIATLGAPKRKRKVVIGLPEPTPGQVDWGVLNGVQLKFSSQNDRLTASKWYVDQVIAKWNALAPANLELAGFYWVPESAYISQVMLPTLKSYITTKGKYYLYHIPHWGAMLRDTWTKYGFDISYQQPNVYFHSQRIVSVAEVVTYAKDYGHSLEFEFDENVMTSRNNSDKRGRFLEYYNEFKNRGVFESYPLTYYQSYFAWSELVKSTDAADLELSKMLGRTIVERQKKADSLIP